MANFEKLGGYVTSSEIFVTKTSDKFHPSGLFSEQIFGPLKDFQCACGNLRHRIEFGKVCPKCGVLCGARELRFKTFGKIKLLFPVIKPTKISFNGATTLQSWKHVSTASYVTSFYVGFNGATTLQSWKLQITGRILRDCDGKNNPVVYDLIDFAFPSMAQKDIRAKTKIVSNEFKCSIKTINE